VNVKLLSIEKKGALRLLRQAVVAETVAGPLAPVSRTSFDIAPRKSMSYTTLDTPLPLRR
jgi:hypothetical protein